MNTVLTDLAGELLDQTPPGTVIRIVKPNAGGETIHQWLHLRSGGWALNDMPWISISSAGLAKRLEQQRAWVPPAGSSGLGIYPVEAKIEPPAPRWRRAFRAARAAIADSRTR